VREESGASNLVALQDGDPKLSTSIQYVAFPALVRRGDLPTPAHCRTRNKLALLTEAVLPGRELRNEANRSFWLTANEVLVLLDKDTVAWSDGPHALFRPKSRPTTDVNRIPFTVVMERTAKPGLTMDRAGRLYGTTVYGGSGASTAALW
jgi:hypothetical protein